MPLIRLLLLVLLMGAAGMAQAEWRRAESPNFIVFSEGPEARLRERIQLLEDFHDLMRRVSATTDAPSPNKLHVYVVSGNRDLRVVRPVAANVGGLYMATGEGIAAVVDAQATGSTNNEVLFHEYAHHFMMQNFSTAYPAWYIEGFAEYFATARFTPRQIDIGNFSPGRAYSVQGPWLPLERLLSAGPDGLNREAGAAYYAQAWLMTHYFYSNAERQAQLRRYLNAARTGNPVGALQTALGMNPEQFTRELRRYIAGGTIRYRRMERTAGPNPPAPVQVTMMPRSANDMMLYAAALHVGLQETDTASYLARIRAAAARHPGDPLATRTLAHAEALHGDRASAARLLDGLIAATPANAELMYLRGRLHLEAAENGGDWDAEVRQAQRWFGQAHRADPNHFQTLYRFAQSHRRGGSATSENTANVLLLAQQLAPQVTEIRMNAAGVLIQRGAIDDAEAMLRPVMSDPHNRELAAAARQLIDRARTPRSPSAAAPAARAGASAKQ